VLNESDIWFAGCPHIGQARTPSSRRGAVSSESAKEDERIAANVAQIVENFGDKRLVLSFFWICLAGIAVIWLSALGIPNLVHEGFGLVFALCDKPGIAVLGLPFGFGLCTTYCLCRLRFPDIEDHKDLGSDLMASFHYQSH